MKCSLVQLCIFEKLDTDTHHKKLNRSEISAFNRYIGSSASL